MQLCATFLEKVTKIAFMKKYVLISMVILTSVCFKHPASAQGVTTYEVDWPAKQLVGTFTLGIGSAFSLYKSTEAVGTLGTGLSQINLTSVGFWVQPGFAELYIYGQNIYGQNITDGIFDNYPPVVHSAYVTWTDANEGWQALVTQGAADGLTIRVVPEPANLTLLCVGLLTLMRFLTSQKLGRMPPPEKLDA
jgi:hypothetical protein